jgi:hypothetical protein
MAMTHEEVNVHGEGPRVPGLSASRNYGRRSRRSSSSILVRALTPVPALYPGVPLHPDDPNGQYGFRLDLAAFGLASARVVFGCENASELPAIHADLAGQPLSFIKRSRRQRSEEVPG